MVRFAGGSSDPAFESAGVPAAEFPSLATGAVGATAPVEAAGAALVAAGDAPVAAGDAPVAAGVGAEPVAAAAAPTAAAVAGAGALAGAGAFAALAAFAFRLVSMAFIAVAKALLASWWCMPLFPS